MFERELDVAVALVARLKGPVAALQAHDPGLAEYLRRAGCQMAVALNEARWHEGAERDALIGQAQDNLCEVYAALQLAESWGHLPEDAIAQVRELVDRELELLTPKKPSQAA